MPTPTCPKCSSTSFEMVNLPVKNANYAHLAIVCHLCGCVVGTEEKMSVTYMLHKIAEKLGVRFE
jgi:transcription initiation factor TFIIIB Brf1 subunit/transcription initiation factor TFIIB